MNFISLVGSIEFFEFFKVSVHANAGISFGIYLNIEPIKNKNGDGFILDLALGLVQLKLVVNANKN